MESIYVTEGGAKLMREVKDYLLDYVQKLKIHNGTQEKTNGAEPKEQIANKVKEAGDAREGGTD